jgi:hypothetical protein
MRLLEPANVTLFQSLFKKPAGRLLAKDFGAVQLGPAARNTFEPSCSSPLPSATLRRAALVLRPSHRVHKQPVLPPLCREPDQYSKRTGLNCLTITHVNVGQIKHLGSDTATTSAKE